MVVGKTYFRGLEVSNKKKVIVPVVIGAGIALTLFFVSWGTHTFDLLVFPQLPGFLVSSWLWGMSGFGHNTAYPVERGGGFLFPFLMIFVNAVFYGALAYLASYIFDRHTAEFDIQVCPNPISQRPTTDDQRQLP